MKNKRKEYKKNVVYKTFIRENKNVQSSFDYNKIQYIR